MLLTGGWKGSRAVKAKGVQVATNAAMKPRRWTRYPTAWAHIPAQATC